MLATAWACARATPSIQAEAVVLLTGPSTGTGLLPGLRLAQPDASRLKIVSMTSAPVVRTECSSRRYTTSVVRELEWPASQAISSTGAPEVAIGEANEWRSSRGSSSVRSSQPGTRRGTRV